VTPPGSPSPTATQTSSPTATASPIPSPTAEPTPSPSPTAEPTPSLVPTESPTLAPTLASTATPTSLPTGSPSNGTGFGADTPIFSDDFSDTTSNAWGTGVRTEGTIEYADGGIRISFTQAPASLWSWHDPGTPWNTMSASGRVLLGTGDGSAGWACGIGEGEFVGGVVNNSAEWTLFEIVASTTTELDSGPLPETVIVSTFYDIGIECAGTATGALRLRMEVDGDEVATFERDTGPANFDRAAVYASTAEAGFSVLFDDAAAFGGTEFGGFPGPDIDQAEVEELLTHVPDAFEANCTPEAPTKSGGLALVRCQPAGTAAQAQYASFADTASMDAAFDDAIGGWDVPEDGSCESGPNKGTYTIGGVDAGRLACGPNPDGGSGVAVVWTDSVLGILSGGVIATEDYPSLYDWWVNDAGPDR
jgi:hypothetical protein